MARWSSLACSLALVLAAVPARADAVLGPLVFNMLQPKGKPAPVATPPPAALADVTGPAVKIDLPQLLQLAVRQSPALASATIDVEIAQAQLDAAMGLDDWRVDAKIDGSNTRTYSTFFQAVTNSRSIGATASVGRGFSTGGTISVGVSNSYSRSPSLDFTTGDLIYQTSYDATATINVFQPLLRGRGREVARALQIENAILADAAALTRRQDAINIVQNVVTEYWDLVAAQRSLEIAQGSLQLAQERLRVTQIGVSGGKVADSELLAVQEAIQTRQEDVINGEVAVLQQSLLLRRTIGMEISPNNVLLDGGEELSIPQREWHIADLLAQAEHSSPQLAALAKQEQNATIVVEVTENGLLPQLDLDLSLGPAGGGATESDALSDLGKLNTLFVQGSLVFSETLGRHQVYGQARANRAQREKIRVGAQDVRLQIAQAMAQAVALVRAAEQRVAVDAKAVELAQKNILVEQSRFELGKSTNFDVLLRQDELRQAQLREARAQVDWHKAQAIIAGLTGTLLPDYGIELK
ncbi:MAG TPA: TolC family protein [Kofleriaceae bacterium]|jgi:outer membrane protein TolC|nr:TolC family protein [Kofleriaceae bacterium]